MDIRTYSLDSELTVAEIGTGTESAWHFLPFEHCRAQLHALDDRYVLAIGRMGERRGTSLGIFDTVERRRTNQETNHELRVYTGEAVASWCYAPAHRSVFVVEMARKSDGEHPNGFQYLRQLSVDGSINRRIQIAAAFSSFKLLARDDGRIVWLGLNQVAVVDPASGEARLSATDLIHPSPTTIDQSLRWFSPDGRWGLRTHPSLIVRPGGPQRAVPLEEEEHPDLASDGTRRVGRALDLFRLDPLGLERRLVIRYDELKDEAFADLEQLCELRDPEIWTTRYDPTMAWWLYRWIERIRWDDDGRGFTVVWAHQTRDVPSPLYGGKVNDLAERHVSLDGVVGPTTVIPGEPKAWPPNPSQTAIKSIQAMVRERSYGSAARTYQDVYIDPITSGPSETSPAAFSEAALTLAMLDDVGFDALRDWVVAVDQEHDLFAAAKVFPAMARRTGFATAEAVRFGLWFFLQQWQTVKYEKTYFGLFKAAAAVMAPDAFASIVLAEAREVASFSSATDTETGLRSVRHMLGRSSWDRAVSAELDRLLATPDDPSPGERSS